MKKTPSSVQNCVMKWITYEDGCTIFFNQKGQMKDILDSLTETSGI